ncbi:nucleotide exchange factor GrpE [Nocardioides sp. STR2]|uniref:Protein GrpE n=1 Tax=Nocardioides pini TaxID=2975053 RepID=A0ABT4CHP1_9ACTN|nr:nucleotide exchange factor GrpE [Nocardioides pini]MCY4728500.1 nucleotide exchange factor GrpE [Nocardioides pini]
MTDRPVEPTPGPEATDLPEGEPTAAPSPEGFGDAAGEAPAQTEVEEQVAGDAVAGDDPGTAEERPDSGDGSDVDTEEQQLAAMKGSLADLTNDLQRLQAEYANYRKRVDRDRQLVAETAAYKALTPVIEVLDTIDRAKEHGELEGGFKAVADQLERVVASAGLVRFGEPGDAFDPTLHEALSHLGADAEVEVTTVKHVAKGGYRMGDRVVRAAQVLVVDPADA